MVPTPSPFITPSSLADVLDAVATEQLHGEFLIGADSGRRLTFGELRDSSRRIAGWLRAQDLLPGDRVALCLHNGLATVELLLGAFRAGLVAVPIPPEAGPASISHALTHSGARLVFTLHDRVDELAALAPSSARVLAASPDDSPEAFGMSTAPAEAPPVRPGDDALLIYTSGSTGVPKGVVLTHGNLVAAGRHAATAHALSSKDRSLCVLPLGHLNALTVTVLPSLVSGGAVVLPRRFEVHRFWSRMEEYQCTWSALVPTLITQLLDTPSSAANSASRGGRQIRFIRSSSAPLSADRKEAFERRFGHPVIEAMGSTEAGGAIFATPLPPWPNKPGSPGVAWGFETRFVDPDGREVDPGTGGELLLRGPSVMRGYFRDPEATASVLSPDGWLRTGDLGRLDEDGYIFLTGRTREVINKGGTKIAPRQIEETLQSHGAVLEAAVVGVSDAVWGQDLAAFVVVRPGWQVLEPELLEFCAARLGPLKTPAWIRFLPELPKGPAGKILRPQLVEAARLKSDERTGSSSPQDPTAVLLRLWKQVLRVDEVRVTDNFFALGGHSLPAMSVLAGLRRELGIALSLSDFLRHPTIEAQVQRMAASSAPVAAPDGEAGPRRCPGSPWPLSPAQTGIWFESQLHPDSFAYHELEAVRLRGALNPSFLGQALVEVVRRHEILGARVALQGDGFVQVPDPDPKPEWTLRDLTHLPPDRREAAAELELVRMARTPFDLENQPGLRGLLLRMGPDDFILGVVMHHLVCDRTSVGILARDLARAYQALLAGRAPEWPELPLSFGDVALAQDRRLTGPDAAMDLAYWRQALAGLPPATGSTDPVSPAAEIGGAVKGGRVRHPLGPDRSRRLRGAARRLGVSPFTVAVTAFQLLVARQTGQEDFVLGVPVASRDHPEWRDLFGLLVDFLPLRVTPGNSVGFVELLHRTHRGLLELMQHRTASLLQIVAALDRPSGSDSGPLFRFAVNWRHHSSELRSIGLDGVVASPFPVHAGDAKFDLLLAVVDHDDVLDLEADFAGRSFSRETVERWLREFDLLLDQAVGGES